MKFTADEIAELIMYIEWFLEKMLRKRSESN